MILVLAVAALPSCVTEQPSPLLSRLPPMPAVLVAEPSEKYVPPAIPKGLRVRQSLDVHRLGGVPFPMELSERRVVENRIDEALGNVVRRASVDVLEFEFSARSAKGVGSHPYQDLVGRPHVVEDRGQAVTVEVAGQTPPDGFPESPIVAITMALTHGSSSNSVEDHPPPSTAGIPVFRVTRWGEPPLASGIRGLLAEFGLLWFDLSFDSPRIDGEGQNRVVVRPFEVGSSETASPISPPLKGHGEVRFGMHSLPVSFTFDGKWGDGFGRSYEDVNGSVTVRATWTYELPAGQRWPHERFQGRGP